VAKGFQEKTKPQADSPTVMQESIKVFLSMEANEGSCFSRHKGCFPSVLRSR
jgi:hypothetical protein